MIDSDVTTDRKIAATQPKIALTVDGIRQSECRPTGHARPEERSMTLMSPTRPVTMAEVRTVTDDVTHLSIGQGETETGQPEDSATRSDPSLYLETATDSPWTVTMPTGQKPYGQINIVFITRYRIDWMKVRKHKRLMLSTFRCQWRQTHGYMPIAPRPREHTPVENCGKFGAIVAFRTAPQLVGFLFLKVYRQRESCSLLHY